MKIGVISDTHIPDRAKRIPKEILVAFKDVDMVIHAGDMANLEALNQLRAVCAHIVAVIGNMDNEEVRNKYPIKQILKLGKFKIGIMHGSGAPAGLIQLLKEAFKADKPDMIIFGHSHTPFNQRIGTALFFNPGSASDKSTSSYSSYGIIEIADKINAKIIKLENE